MKNKYIIYIVFVLLILILGLYLTSDRQLQKNMDDYSELINDAFDQIHY